MTQVFLHKPDSFASFGKLDRACRISSCRSKKMNLTSLEESLKQSSQLTCSIISDCLL